ncbi:MAG: hypothetical protein ACO3FE_19230, partial [Planctomycetaceae bacterium]
RRRAHRRRHRPAESRFVSASFVDDADGFVAAFGSLTEWNHVDRAGNDLAGVAPIAEGTDRLRAGLWRRSVC